MTEWSESTIIGLDADAPRLWEANALLPPSSKPHSTVKGEHGSFEIEGVDIAFVLSDDKPLPEEFKASLLMRSLGDVWLQGHMAIGVCHFLLDEGVELTLTHA